MILHPKHDVFISEDSIDPIFRYGDKCILSMRDITHALHSENGYIDCGTKYMIYNYVNIDNRIEFFVGYDDDISIVRDFLKNFMREDEFRMQQIASSCKGKISLKQLELLR